jgi:hypothetical protein
MSEQRKLIRHEVVAILTGQIAAVGARVFASRKAVLFHDELPCIAVYTDGENPPTLISDGPREYGRTCRLKIEIVADGANEISVEDQLDDIAHQVEQILFRNDTLNSKCTRSQLGEVTNGYSVDGEKVIGACSIAFDVSYPQLAPDPATDNLPAFETAGVELAAGPTPDGVPEIGAEIAVPQ